LYQLKEGEKTLSLKSEASETASDLVSVNSNETLAKIRTVDKAWIYVAVYDEAEKRASEQQTWVC
jgi:predicted metal-dependent TIM-barrel fold hydrolase